MRLKKLELIHCLPLFEVNASEQRAKKTWKMSKEEVRLYNVTKTVDMQREKSVTAILHWGKKKKKEQK